MSNTPRRRSARNNQFDQFDVDISRALGQIEGHLDQIEKAQDSMKKDQKASQVALNLRLDSIDQRLRKVEFKSAKLGAGAGFLSAVGVSVIAEWLRRNIGL